MGNDDKKRNDINELDATSPVWRRLARMARPNGSEGANNRPGDGGEAPSAALVALPSGLAPSPAVAAMALEDHSAIAEAYLASRRSVRTEQTMRESLDRVATVLGAPSWQAVPWAAIRRNDVQAAFIGLQRRYGKRTVNLAMSALRGVLEEAWDRGLISGDDLARCRKIQNLKVSRLPRGRGLADAEIALIDAHCRALGPESRDWPESAYGAFLAAAFALMLGLGLRASEAASVTVAAYDRRSRELRVVGKGDKERLAPLGDDVVPKLEAWLAVRGELDVPADIPALLVRVTRAGVLASNPRLNRRKLEHLCKLEARRAGLQQFSPHDLRRTFCTDMLTDGTDLATQQRLMGHESPETTALYDRRPAELDAAARRRVNILGRRPSADT